MRAINPFQILWAWGRQVCKAGSSLCQPGRKNTLETGMHQCWLQLSQWWGGCLLPIGIAASCIWGQCVSSSRHPGVEAQGLVGEGI